MTTLLGAYGLTVVTALTVQNSQGVTAVHPVAPEVVAAQLDAVLSDFPVAAVKVGMLATPALVRTVAERLKSSGRLPWCWTRCWPPAAASRCSRPTVSPG